MNPAMKWLVPLIFVLALVAALAGLWPAEGQPYPLTNFRGEAVTINARGLYYWDTIGSTAAMQANDLVTLVLGLPLLALSLWLTLRGSLRGKLILTGTLGFFLYTYASMCFGTAYNAFFLVYVALFAASLYAFILSMMSFDVANLPARFSEKLPRNWIAGLNFFAAAFLLFAWLGRVIPTLSLSLWERGGVKGIPTLENTTSMFIQAMDLSLIVPLCLLSGILLLRRQSWGYLLASVGMLKFITMGTAVSLMGLNMARMGVPVSVVELAVFPTITLVNLVMVVILLRNIKE